MTKSNHHLDQLLNCYTVPPPHDGLAAKIVTKALSIPQKQPLWQIVQSIFKECHLPSPLYTMASLLMISFFLGFSVNNSHVVNEVKENAFYWLIDEEEEIIWVRN